MAQTLPLLDQGPSELHETATFALGCFWGPDARFGALDGVLRTRVGYAGGTTDQPTYKTMGDHMETLQLDYDPRVQPYTQLLELFFNSHSPYHAPWKRQYGSAIFYHTAEQHRLIEEKIGAQEAETGKKVHTEVNPYSTFYLAEERHQKYKLQRQPVLLAKYRRIYPDVMDFINSTAVARVNGYLSGCENREKVRASMEGLGLSAQGQQVLLQLVTTTTTGANCG